MPDQKFIYILWQSQTFCARQKDYLHSVKFLGWLKKFGQAQNILGPVKGQGIRAFIASSKTFVQAQKTILLNANHLFVWHKMSVTATICK